MKWYVEESLRNFPFWSGAKDTVEDLTYDDLDTIESMLEDVGDDWSDTAINDFFWFERDTIAEWLGYDDYDELMHDRNED